jgi:hypothetical protein
VVSYVKSGQPYAAVPERSDAGMATEDDPEGWGWTDLGRGCTQLDPQLGNHLVSPQQPWSSGNLVYFNHN